MSPSQQYMQMSAPPQSVNNLISPGRTRSTQRRQNLNHSSEVFERNPHGKDMLIRNGASLERGDMKLVDGERPASNRSAIPQARFNMGTEAPGNLHLPNLYHPDVNIADNGPNEGA